MSESFLHSSLMTENRYVILKGYIKILFASSAEVGNKITSLLVKCEHEQTLDPIIYQIFEFDHSFINLLCNVFDTAMQFSDKESTDGFKKHNTRYIILKSVLIKEPENYWDLIDVFMQYQAGIYDYKTAQSKIISITTSPSYFKLLSPDIAYKEIPEDKINQILCDIEIQKYDSTQLSSTEKNPVSCISNTSHVHDLAQLISISDTDIYLLTGKFPEPSNNTIDDYSETVFKYTELDRFDLPYVKGHRSYRDTIEKYYDPSFSGQILSDAFNLNVRYMSVMVGDVKAKDAEDNPSEILHDHDFAMEVVERSLYRDPCERKETFLKQTLKKIYTDRALRTIWEHRNNEKVFEDVIKPRLMDLAVELRMQYFSRLEISFFMMYKDGAMSFKPFKFINKANNYLVTELGDQLERVLPWIENTMYEIYDRVKKKGEYKLKMTNYDLELIRRFLSFYKYYVLTVNPTKVPKGHPALMHASFMWDSVHCNAINFTAESICKYQANIRIPDLEKSLSETMKELASFRKPHHKEHQYKEVTWRCHGQKLWAVVKPMEANNSSDSEFSSSDGEKMKPYGDEVEYVFETIMQDRRRHHIKGGISNEEQIDFLELLEHFESRCQEGITMEDYAEMLPPMVKYFLKLDENNVQTIVSDKYIRCIMDVFIAEKENLLRKPVSDLVKIISIYSTFSNESYLNEFCYLQTLFNVIIHGNGEVKENAETALCNSCFFPSTCYTLEGRDEKDIYSFDVPEILLSMNNLENKALFFAFFTQNAEVENTAILLSLITHGVNLFSSSTVQAFPVLHNFMIGIRNLLLKAGRMVPLLEKISELFNTDVMEKISACLFSSEVSRSAASLLYTLFTKGIRSDEIREDVLMKTEDLILDDDPKVACSGLYLISCCLNVKFDHELVPGGPVEHVLSTLQTLIKADDLPIDTRLEGVGVFKNFLVNDSSIMCYINNELADTLVELLINVPSDENMITLLDTINLLCSEGHGILEYLASDEFELKEDLLDFLDDSLEESSCCQEAWEKADILKSTIENCEKGNIVIRGYDDWD